MQGEPDDPRIGQVLDRYRLVRRLGAGGFGDVYEAVHLKLDLRVAVKILKRDVPASIVQRFEDEGRAAARLKSPNIVGVTDAGTAPDGAHFLVYELLDGNDLEAELRAGRMSAMRAAEIAMQIAFGLSAAHQAGLVHRDLKPGNVFLARSPSGEMIAKILDFGISKFMGKSPSKQTPMDLVLGTLLYMSPEQWRASALVDAKADIWSLGAALYEMLTGRPPFVAETIPALLGMIMEDAPPALAGIDPAFAALVFRCLEKDPSKRPASMRELCTSLEPFTTAPTIIVDSTGEEGPRSIGEALRGWI